MSNLPSQASPRKSFLAEVPPAALRPVPPPGLTGLGLDRPDEFYRLLSRLNAPPSVHKLARFLESKAIEFRDFGTWMSLRSMSRHSGIKISTLRDAMRRLITLGLVVSREVEIFGEIRTMFWLRWLMPGGPVPESLPQSARGARFSVQEGARQSARLQERDWEDKKTTDRVRGRVVVPAAPCPEADADAGGGRRETPPPATPPPPEPELDLDPAVAAALEAEVPDESERTQVGRQAAAWLARFAVDWVVKAIRETAGRRRKGEPLVSFAAYAAAILGIWAKQGRATPRLAKSTISRAPGANGSLSGDRPPALDPAVVAAAARADAAYRARTAADPQTSPAAGSPAQSPDPAPPSAEEAQLALWRALSVPDRDAIKAGVLAENPLAWRLPKLMQALCLTAMEGTADS